MKILFTCPAYLFLYVLQKKLTTQDQKNYIDEKFFET